jgi:hypothetical protein
MGRDHALVGLAACNHPAMSRIAEILLHVDPVDEPVAEELSFWIRNEAPRSDNRTEASAGYLLPLAGEVGQEAWGGSKLPALTLWAGVTNHVRLDALVDRVGTVRWEEPESVQLLVRDESDPWFRLYMIRDTQIREYTPVPPVEQKGLDDF